MDQKHVVAICMGAAFLLAGFFLTTNERVAAWGLSHGRGRFWVSLLGLERAMAVTRFFFGPLTMVLGLVGIAIGLFGK